MIYVIGGTLNHTQPQPMHHTCNQEVDCWPLHFYATSPGKLFTHRCFCR